MGNGTEDMGGQGTPNCYERRTNLAQVKSGSETF
jgi:hypothetical protein